MSSDRASTGSSSRGAALSTDAQTEARQLKDQGRQGVESTKSAAAWCSSRLASGSWIRGRLDQYVLRSHCVVTKSFSSGGLHEHPIDRLERTAQPRP
jgi:hypothetical protein